MELEKVINSVRSEIAKRFDLKTDAEIDAFFIGAEESAKNNQEALESGMITKDELCRMCLEYSADMTCEHIRECKLMKVLDENKRLKEKVRKLEYEQSWIDSPESMGR